MAFSDLSATAGQTIETRVSVPDAGGGFILSHQSDQLGSAQLTNVGSFSLPKGGTITERCSGDDGTVQGYGDMPEMFFSSYYLTAVRAGTLHSQ